MHCPFCRHEDTRVIDSRTIETGKRIRRRRDCPACQMRFNTIESLEMNMPRVIKRSFERCSFDEEKLKKGILKAIEKRPVSSQSIDQLFNQILQAIHRIGDKEISTEQIGKVVMNGLKQLDSVAFIRFASVYLSIQDIDAFKAILDIAQDNSEIV